MQNGWLFSLWDHAIKWRDFIFDLIFPKECFSCGQEGDWLCDKCFKKIKIIESQKCFHCRKENDFGDFCPSCQLGYFLDGVWIAGDYNNKILANLIKNFKYHFIKDLSLILGKYLALFLRDLLNRNRLVFFNSPTDAAERQVERVKKQPAVFLYFKNILVIFVPLHKKRLKWRGFNQSEILAGEVADYFGLEVGRGKLLRVKHRRAQAKLKAEERHHNIKDCFDWQAEALGGRNVVLVDDVATTGSTLNECARVLKENGAGEVWGLVIARG